jgi:hypothetical protein
MSAPLPKALSPRCARWRRVLGQVLLVTIFMPRPPPPAAALMISGRPICARAFSRAVALIGDQAPEPGQDGHTGRHHRLLGADLVAHECGSLGLGPMNVNPHLRQTSANSAFSERKP